MDPAILNKLFDLGVGAALGGLCIFVIWKLGTLFVQGVLGTFKAISLSLTKHSDESQEAHHEIAQALREVVTVLKRLNGKAA